MSRDIWQENQICVEHGRHRCDICAWIDELKSQAAAEKERADKAERKEQKLKESLEHCIKEFPQWDSKEIAGTLMVDYMNNILSILYPKEETKPAVLEDDDIVKSMNAGPINFDLEEKNETGRAVEEME